MLAGAAAVGVCVGGLAAAGWWAARNFEPYARTRMVEYLERRFEAEVALERVHVKLQWASLWREAEVDVGRVRLKLKRGGQVEARAVRFLVDTRALRAGARAAAMRWARMEDVVVRVPSRKPGHAGMEIFIERAEVRPEGGAMRYEARLQCPKPPGLIRSRGLFGPWAGRLAETPVAGEYTFENANLGVFRGIAGTLASEGRFRGVLQEIVVDGRTSTPDFRLKGGGSAMKLETEFHAIVDGTNGDTRLEPVTARLGGSRMTVRGSVERDAAARGRVVALTARVEEGRIEDFLKLAVPGQKTFVEGGLGVQARVVVLPGRGEVTERLKLKGTFVLNEARFTSARVQEQVDGLSRRAQGQPLNENISEVPCAMAGEFETGDGRMKFPWLKFGIPGAEVELAGEYRFGPQWVDFEGEARIEAQVSQMMKTRWKRWVLKPVDPFFRKKGFGTVTKVRVTGPREKPKFERR